MIYYLQIDKKIEKKKKNHTQSSTGSKIMKHLYINYKEQTHNSIPY